MRSFIAIEVPDNIKTAIEELSGRLRASGTKASWVKPDNIHLTLRFLGSIEERRVNLISERLNIEYRDVAPFTLRVSGVRTFPNVHKPSVVWVGLEPAEGPLAVTQEIAETAAIATGFPRETKPFRAHMTVARIRNKLKLGNLIEALESEKDFSTEPFTVDTVALFSSDLTRNGSIYTKLGEFQLCKT